MMSIENPETINEIVCVAPAEGQRPLSIMTDSIFETMSNPENFLLVMEVLQLKDPAN